MNDENLVLIKDIVQGDFKNIPGALLTRWIDKKQFENIFIEAGATVANYERTGREESREREILFCENNMKGLAEYMRQIDDLYITGGNILPKRLCQE